jgi:hypothetical protein
MSLFRNPGRFAGLLYVLSSIIGVFGLLVVPSQVIVHGDAAATAQNIAAHETLFRLGIVANLACQTLFIFVALALFHLFKDVNRRHALVMLTLILAAIPIALLNELNAIAALTLVRGSGSFAGFNLQQRDTLVMLFLNLHASGFDIAGILWGLWLFPLGLLAYRSGFIPRILGIALMVNCFSYPINTFMSIVLPQYAETVAVWTSPFQFCEVVFMIWLLFAGAKPTQPRSGIA